MIEKIAQAINSRKKLIGYQPPIHYVSEHEMRELLREKPELQKPGGVFIGITEVRCGSI